MATPSTPIKKLKRVAVPEIKVTHPVYMNHSKLMYSNGFKSSRTRTANESQGNVVACSNSLDLASGSERVYQQSTLYSPMITCPHSLNNDSSHILANVFHYIHKNPQFTDKTQAQVQCPRVSLDVIKKQVKPLNRELNDPRSEQNSETIFLNSLVKFNDFTPKLKVDKGTMTDPVSIEFINLVEIEYPCYKRNNQDTDKIENDSKDIIYNVFEYFDNIGNATKHWEDSKSQAPESATKFSRRFFRRSLFRKAQGKNASEKKQNVEIERGAILLDSIRRFQGPKPVRTLKIRGLDVNQRKQLLDLKNKMKKEFGFPPPVKYLHEKIVEMFGSTEYPFDLRSTRRVYKELEGDDYEYFDSRIHKLPCKTALGPKTFKFRATRPNCSNTIKKK